MREEVWKTQTGFVLAAVGSAIGLGNIWRFGYIAFHNGGGAFLIPYAVALLTAGIPLLILEFALGSTLRSSSPRAFARVRRGWEWVGWWCVIFALFGITLYYTVIISWCANFVVLASELRWGSNPNRFFFQEFLSTSGSPFEIGGIRVPILIGLIGIWGLNWVILVAGIRKGIERTVRIFMPLLLILFLLLLGWSITLEGAITGIDAYLSPDFSALTRAEVWLAAYGQTFFSLSLGFGIMIAYASYLPKDVNIARNAVIAACLDGGFALLAGSLVFAVLGFMAHQQDTSLMAVVQESIGLAFVAYPQALNVMPAGAVFGVVFFLCLVLAGLTSMISMVEAFVSGVVDKFGWHRKQVVTVSCLLGLIGSIIFATRSGLYWLDIVDHFLTHYGLVVVGLLECLVIAHTAQFVMIRNRFCHMFPASLVDFWGVLVRFVVPSVLALVLTANLYQELQAPYGQYSWISVLSIGWGWIAVTLLAGFIIAKRPWRIPLVAD